MIQKNILALFSNKFIIKKYGDFHKSPYLNQINLNIKPKINSYYYDKMTIQITFNFYSAKIRTIFEIKKYFCTI